MYESKNPIDRLVHEWIDGALNRRQLIREVAKRTGSVAAAVTALAGYEELQAQTQACPAGIKVPVDAPDIVASDVQFAGDAGTVFGHLAYPRSAEPRDYPGVIVIHENRGLVEHIKDVTRRVARAGFVGLGVDLLSRQGGTHTIDPAQLTQAYGRTNQFERRSDLIAGLTYLKSLTVTQFDRIGAVGFCAGGGNVWDFAINIEELAAAVPYYGAPAPPLADLERIKAPVMAIYAETDRNLTMALFPVANAMIQQRKTFGFMVYEGAAHSFHNDTGNAYNAEAACDAWARTIAFFNKFLRKPRE